ncbi:hypothetical protein [Evansella tamaricis]
MAKEVLDVRYMHLYIPVYLFAIWDSYRTTVDLNKIYHLSGKKTDTLKTQKINPFEINYLDKRNPATAVMWAMSIPSTGQLYIHRIAGAFFTLVMAVVLVHYSQFFAGIHYLLLGDSAKSTSVLDKQWLLYIPSFYLFTIYDTYINTVENNKLYELEQRNYLKANYQPKSFKVKKGKKVI